jgi:hypothetical protein
MAEVADENIGGRGTKKKNFLRFAKSVPGLKNVGKKNAMLSLGGDGSHIRLEIALTPEHFRAQFVRKKKLCSHAVYSRELFILARTASSRSVTGVL